MKLCYLVYREENVMVYESQVLEYLRSMKRKRLFDSIELIVFRHEQNLTKKGKVESRIRNYVDKCHTFWSLPTMSMAQLYIDSARLRNYLSKTYKTDDEIAVICRGDLAAYIGVRAFSKYDGSRILYDNRGLAYEESALSHHNNVIHTINRNVKREALNRAKMCVDMYNFVTNGMRSYFLEQYNFDTSLPFTIIPTLYHAGERDEAIQADIQRKEAIDSEDFVVSYIGSTAAWQSTEKLLSIIKQIGARYNKVRFFILTNGTFSELELLPKELREKIIIKNVPHNEIKYYLHMTDIGIVIRDDSIINQVAAPTKIAEYLTNGVKVLYSGRIGIIDDLTRICGESQLINIDKETKWIDKLDPSTKIKKTVEKEICDYFDMDKRQMETFEMLVNAFRVPKVK